MVSLSWIKNMIQGYPENNEKSLHCTIVVRVSCLLDFLRVFWLSLYIDNILELYSKPLRSLHSGSACTVYTVYCKLIYGTMYTVQYTVYTVQCTVYGVHCTIYTGRGTLYSVQCTVYSVYFTLYTVHCTLSTVYCTLYTVYCTLYTVNWYTLYTVNWYTLYTVHCVMYTV